MHARFRTAKLCVTAAVATTAVVLLAGPAGAHVEVEPSTAPKGAEAQILTFSVPTEREDASTTKLEIQIPANAKFTEVLVQPKPGWTVSTAKTGSIVSTVTWTGGEIKPGEFDLFTINVGPLPKKGKSVTFKALQTYSDGQVVRWIEQTKKGAPEPEHPAPVLTLTAKKKGGH